MKELPCYDVPATLRVIADEIDGDVDQAFVVVKPKFSEEFKIYGLGEEMDFNNTSGLISAGFKLLCDLAVEE